MKKEVEKIASTKVQQVLNWTLTYDDIDGIDKYKYTKTQMLDGEASTRYTYLDCTTTETFNTVQHILIWIMKHYTLPENQIEKKNKLLKWKFRNYKPIKATEFLTPFLIELRKYYELLQINPWVTPATRADYELPQLYLFNKSKSTITRTNKKRNKRKTIS